MDIKISFQQDTFDLSERACSIVDQMGDPATSFVSPLPKFIHRYIVPCITMNSESTSIPSSNAALWSQMNLSTKTLISAHFHAPESDIITAIWTQRDPSAGKKRYFQSSHVTVGKESISTPMVELGSLDSATFHFSPTRSKSLRFVPRPTGEPGLLAELWSDEGVQFSWTIPESLHGVVYSADEWFAPVAWSPDEKFVAYIADAPGPSNESFTETERNDPNISWSHPLKFKFHADSRGPFGETYVKHRSPALFIAEVMTGSVSLAAHPSEWHLAQPQWTRTGWIICSARRTGSSSKSVPRACPDDLGVRYCYNRLCCLVGLRAPDGLCEISNVAETLTLITDPEDPLDFCCISPRASIDGRDLVYVAAPAGSRSHIEPNAFPHNRQKILRYVQVDETGFSKPKTLIDGPHSPSWEEFPGLFLHGLPQQPWIGSNTLALTTTWHSTDRVVTVTFPRRDGTLTTPGALHNVITDAQIDPEKPENEQDKNDAPRFETGSVSLLDVLDGKLLVSCSDTSTPPRLATIQNKHLKWISPSNERGRHFTSIVSQTKSVALVITEDCNHEDMNAKARYFDPKMDKAESAFEVIIISPHLENDEKPGLAVFPHGGPHTATVKGFSVATTALLSRGFVVLLVNYRGSIGFGQASLESLLGRIGTQDVSEVIQATRWALDTEEFRINRDKVVFIGGSHSGFLGAHVSLVPGLFKRTVLRNPVVNLSTMVGATDIPDWCFAEAGLTGKGEGAFVPNAEDMKSMFEKSPISRVSAAKRKGAYPKTLLQVGGSDRRVPPSQSLEWRKILTASFDESVILMRWYEQASHSIDNVPEGDDAWVHTLDFICEVNSK